MKYVCMDTSHRHLVIALIEDQTVVAGCAIPSWKKQSETIFPKWIELMDQAGWQASQIGALVVSVGPGSYTGVRIAMTIAKVFATTRNVPLYTLSTLQLYAGMMENAYVMLDARSNRAYVGKLHNGVFIEEPSIKTLDEIKAEQNDDLNLIGDLDLLGMPKTEVDFVANFCDLKPLWQLVQNSAYAGALLFEGTKRLSGEIR